MWSRRQLSDGIRWRTRTGAPWSDVPQRYGPWGRVYDLFRRRQRDGVRKHILRSSAGHRSTALRFGSATVFRRSAAACSTPADVPARAPGSSGS
ncbi:transposase, partial [Streptomyces sp. sk2.1]|uniref:transposase n=1 Tax=Streptomyces sp. sk2.1 TaxID=2478959 RepID=UPI0021CC91AE